VRCPACSMVWPASPGATACAGVCRVSWTFRRAGCLTSGGRVNPRGVEVANEPTSA
jgi:hypothetical protein